MSQARPAGWHAKSETPSSDDRPAPHAIGPQVGTPVCTDGDAVHLQTGHLPLAGRAGLSSEKSIQGKVQQ